VLVNTQFNDVGALTISTSGHVAVAGSSASGFTGLDGISFVAGE
jgi:hypothetical protein